MKTAVLIGMLIVSMTSAPALAISRYNSGSYTCSQTQALIQRERAVILRYPAQRSKMTLFDRFVADRDACDSGYYTDRSYIPTKDLPNCPVYTCRPGSDFDPR